MSLLALSSASGQQAQAISDALVVETLAPELDSVQLGRVEALNEEQGRLVARESIGFRFEKDLNSDGQEESILLGDFAEGETRQSFVLIATQAADGQLVRSQLFTFDRDFIVGRLGRSEIRRDDLAVFFCLRCDQGGWIEWTGSAYEFRPYPPQGVSGTE